METDKLFEQAHANFLQFHLERREGERLRRLAEGHDHAEALFLQLVWWPTFGHFDNLHPEYEIVDYRHGNRFLDFAYIRPPFRLAIEVDGFGPHLQRMSRWQFADQWRRQNQLVIDGWKMLRFSYDDVRDKPRICQQTIQQMFGRWLHIHTLGANHHSPDHLNPYEKETYRLAVKLNRPLTVADVCKELDVSPKKARNLLHQLKEKGWLLPASGSVRIRSYRPAAAKEDILI